MRSHFLTTAAITLAISLTAPVNAQNAPQPQDETDGTQVSLGAAILYSPEYTGAGETQVRLLPYIEIYNFYGFDLRPFALTYDVIDWQSGEGLWGKSFRAGPLASYGFGREESDASELAGLGDLDRSILAGGFISARYGPIGIRIEGGQDILDSHGGAQFDMSLGTRLPIGEGSLTGALTSRWGSDDYNNAYYGITAEQAAASQFTGYEVRSGVFSNGATLLLSYPVKDKWTFTALASYQKYVDDVADSPILSTDTGSDSATRAVFALSRKFDFGN